MTSKVFRAVRFPTIVVTVSAIVCTGPIGCATSSGSQDEGARERIVDNTRRFKEQTQLVCWDRPAESEAQAVPLLIPLALFAAKVAIQLVQHLIQMEADKYEATSSALAALDISSIGYSRETGRPTMRGRVDFMFVRTVEPAASEILLPLSDQSLSAFVNDAVKAIANSGATGPTGSEITQVLRGAAQAGRCVTFCAIGRFVPRTDGESFNVELLCYSYPALKAKSATKMGFPERRDDHLVISLTGPQSPPAAIGTFGVSNAFPVEAAANGSMTFKVVSTPEKRVLSKPIATPAYRAIVATATLTETSNFKALLERAATEVGKLDPAKVVSLFE